MSEHLSFRLGAEEYGIEILKVREIRNYEHVTRIANTPDFIKGVIDLRGVIVPIVDLRLKFGLSEARYDPFTVVIILNLERRVVGIVVDSVSDVVELPPGEIRPAPEFAGSLDVKFIRGLAPVGDRMILVADIERLMASRDLQLVDTEALAA